MTVGKWLAGWLTAKAAEGNIDTNTHKHIAAALKKAREIRSAGFTNDNEFRGRSS